MVNKSDILNARVLVVDDKEANVRLLEGMLRVAGYTSVDVDDGSERRSANFTARTVTT